MSEQNYDVVIVGAGIAGALIAKQLGKAGKKVLILEAGLNGQGTYENYLERFYLAQAKVPEAPWTPPIVDEDLITGFQAPSDPSTMAAGRPTTLTLTEKSWQDPHQSYLDQQGPLAFSSTYERVGGGTMRHWLGTSLRFVPNDFKTKTVYNVQEDWPIGYDDLEPWYEQAEAEIGIAADVKDQDYLGITFPSTYQYPMPPIPASLVDQAVTKAMPSVPPIDGIQLEVTNTPAGRNSIPYQGRRVCAGNTNCIPICPIQAKYDPTVTLAEALQFPTVSIMYQTVASEVLVGADGQVSGINYLQYTNPNGPATGSGSVSAARYVLAGHAIETPKLLLMSKNGGRTKNGVANNSGHLGQHLMDHPIYLSWALAKDQLFAYRGPLSTAGVESLRDGAFRDKRAAFRIEIGNEGWNFPIGDPSTTTLDFVVGTNVSQLNTSNPNGIFGNALTATINGILTRQFRLGFLMEQTPDDDCTVTLSSTYKDSLGLPRPQIRYNFSDYTKMGFVAAKKTATAIYDAMNAKEFTTLPGPDDLGKDPTVFSITYDADGNPVPDGQAPPAGSTTDYFRFFGAGHTVGTYRMGTDETNSVVNSEQRSWDHPNLFLVGSGVFPTVATGNPTLTLAALSLWAAKTVLVDLA
jgi:glucose dehydrogenase